VKKTPPAGPVSAAAAVAHRRFLYATAATTGAAILIVEILGAKMLAPYLGTSHFVWTAQIAVTLVALASGYYAGGRLADHAPHPRRLYGGILAAALYLAGSVLIVEPVAYWCLRFKLALGSLLASLFLFFVPLSLLAMVCPFLVRVMTESLAGVGSNVGRLTAISTLGSVAGTVLIGYVLIPFLPNPLTMYLTAAVLLAVAVLHFLVFDRQPGPRSWLVVLTGLFLLCGAGLLRLEQLAQAQGGVQRLRRNSNFGLLQVLDDESGRRRLYLNDYLVQNTYDPVRKQSRSMFTYLLHELARAYTPRIDRALCIGLGVGIVPMHFVRDGAAVDVVEINPAVPPIAKEFFDCELERLHVALTDGRYFLNQAAPAAYDTIILDAFLGDSSPVHLFTQEAFAAMRRALTPQGTVVINCFGDFTAGKDFFVASLEKTLREGAGFPSVRIHAAGSGNVFFVASPQPQLTLRRQPDFNDAHPACREQARLAFATLQHTNPEHGVVLTDAFNPLEYYDAVNRETYRRQYALGFRALRGH
jgi:spermidine synthase